MAPKQALLSFPRPARKRAVGIIRVSEVDGRSGDSFRSPDDQLKILEQFSELHNYTLVATFRELDVSGYSLSEIHQRKHGLAPAIKMIEAGEADVLLLPWLDRIARNLDLFRAARRRIQAAGGSIEAVDFGVVTGGTAAQRFSSEILIQVAEFFAELTAEKTYKAKEAAVAQGIPCFDRIPFGYRKDPDPTSQSYRRLIVHEQEAEAVRAAFVMRDEGSSLEAIRDFLRTQGATYGINGVQRLLQQRMYLGEIRFGKLTNVHSHEAIVDPGLFRSVQGRRIVKGPRKGPQADRLLARLGIVRCASCDHPMIVGGQVRKAGKAGLERKKYFDYRCSSMHDCPQHVAISADILEQYVVEYVKQADASGHASVDEEYEVALRVYHQAEEALSNVVEMLSGLGDLKAAADKLADMRAARDEAHERCQQLRALRGTAGVRAADWDDLTLTARRALIRSAIRRIVISPGKRGGYVGERVQIETFAQ